MSIATIRSSRSLLYTAGADASLDRPAHVRSASGIAWIATDAGPRLALCQDDAAFVALVALTTAAPLGVGVDVESVVALELPAGPGGERQFDKGRGNKMDKRDFESACVVPSSVGERLWLVGSGSAPVREVIAELDPQGPSLLRFLSTAQLCDALRTHALMRGAELNLEGACAVGGADNATLYLLQRGNGVGGVTALAAVPLADVAAERAPATLTLLPFELPRVRDVPLTPTDLCLLDGARALFTAAAEASPNAIDDGEVVGCAIGVLSLATAKVESLWMLHEVDGAASVRKPEGLCLLSAGDARTVVVVTDADDPVKPSDLMVVDLPHDARAHS